MAGANLACQTSKGEVGEAVRGDVVDRGIEQLLTWIDVRHEPTVPNGTSTCTVWYMPKPVTVSVEVPHEIDAVYEFLDVMANHEPFNDHLMTDWELSGPDRGIGSKARVRTRALGVSDIVDIEVVEAEPPTRIVELNVAAKAKRTGRGTYTLSPLPAGGTLVTFEYRWIVAPLIDRVTAPMARAYIRRNNNIAMRRLAEQLDRVHT